MKASEIDRPVFDISDRGFRLRCFHIEGQTSMIVIERDGKTIREFEYEAYRVWNIAAHFGDIVDELVEEDAEKDGSHFQVVGATPSEAGARAVIAAAKRKEQA